MVKSEEPDDLMLSSQPITRAINDLDDWLAQSPEYVPEGWYLPQGDISPSFIEQIPNDSCMLGLYYNAALVHAEACGVDVSAIPKAFPFSKQPMADILSLYIRALQTQRPGSSLREQLFTTGQLLLSQWSKSAVGKPLLDAMGEHLEASIYVCKPGYSMSFTRGRSAVIYQCSEGAIIDYHDVHWGFDTVQFGIFAAFGALFDASFSMLMREGSAEAGMFLLRW
jgi:hypothetical protein